MSGKPHKIKERSILFALIKAIFKVICIWGVLCVRTGLQSPCSCETFGCLSGAAVLMLFHLVGRGKKRKTTKRNSLGRFAQAFKKRLGSGSEPSIQGGLTSIPQHCKNHPRWPRPGLLSLGSGDKGDQEVQGHPWLHRASEVNVGPV